MKMIDDETAILKDSSIAIFKDDGFVIYYPSREWKRPKCNKKYGKVFTYMFSSKKQAIDIFNKIDED